jgi:hypothetical protein
MYGNVAPDAGGSGIVRDQSGSNAVLIGIFAALLTAVVIVVGVAVWNRYQRSHHVIGEPLSTRAELLKYSQEEMYRKDLAMENDALTRLLGSAGGSQLLWQNAESGNRGITWNSFENERGCREIERRTMINDIFHEESATVCRDAAGHWPSKLAWGRRR